MERRIYRCPEQGKIAGVCYGLAEYFRVDPKNHFNNKLKRQF